MMDAIATAPLRRQIIGRIELPKTRQSLSDLGLTIATQAIRHLVAFSKSDNLFHDNQSSIVWLRPTLEIEVAETKLSAQPHFPGWDPNSLFLEQFTAKRQATTRTRFYSIVPDAHGDMLRCRTGNTCITLKGTDASGEMGQLLADSWGSASWERCKLEPYSAQAIAWLFLGNSYRELLDGRVQNWISKRQWPGLLPYLSATSLVELLRTGAPWPEATAELKNAVRAKLAANDGSNSPAHS